MSDAYACAAVDCSRSYGFGSKTEAVESSPIMIYARVDQVDNLRSLVCQNLPALDEVDGNEVYGLGITLRQVLIMVPEDMLGEVPSFALQIVEQPEAGFDDDEDEDFEDDEEEQDDEDFDEGDDDDVFDDDEDF